MEYSDILNSEGETLLKGRSFSTIKEAMIGLELLLGRMMYEMDTVKALGDMGGHHDFIRDIAATAQSFALQIDQAIEPDDERIDKWLMEMTKDI